MLKNLKSLFIIEDEEDKGKGKSKENASVAKKATPSESTPVKSESKEGAPGKVTNKFMDVLFAAMEKSNIEGFDYLEYKQSLRSLSKMPMDEQTRYQSAFAMASTMGADMQKLVETAQHYLKVLGTEETKFEQALANQKNQQIGKKKEQIESTEAIIQQKSAQIKKLTQEIEQHRKKTETLQKEISEATVKVESTKNNFIASYNALVSQIQQDIENIKKYLK
jgi:predicted RNase H-like nuclease (RuvC/YqgF family)